MPLRVRSLHIFCIRKIPMSPVGIENETQVKAELFSLDQSNFASVVSFMKTFGEDPVDVAVLNAGMVTLAPQQTDDGWEAWWVYSLSRMSN